MTHALTDVAESKASSSSERSRKFMNVTVYFLDDSSHVFQLQAKNLGQVLFDKVCKFINLLEVDYFGLEFEDDKKSKCWLDALKPLCSQISTSFPTMHLCVKFYTPDPVQLEDEFTRYLFGLQVKKDLANGFMQCNDNTSAVMVSYIVQADFGDFNPEKCEDGSYLSAYKFVPLQDKELERKVLENHKRLTGQTPAEADLNLLETARRCELYGIKMTAAKDHEGVPLNLAVAHLGILVFQNYTKINTFSWAKIRKLSFKRKKFLIKLHPEGYGYYKDTVEFFFDGRNECKNFWKKCIENHTFFRCTDAKHGMRQRPKIFSRGSSFRYSGRTQKQVSEYVRENGIKRPPFQRSTSLRTPTSPSRSIGSSVSPQPLLPVTSLSCGSISDACKDTSKQGEVSPNAQGTPAVTPGEDSRDDITYDNVSHDSYDVLERESEDTNCMPATNSRPNTADSVEDPENERTDANSKDSLRTRTNSVDAPANETNSKDALRSRNSSEDAPKDDTNSNCMPTNTSSEVNSVAIPDEYHKKLEKLENNNNTMQTTEEKIMNDIKELNASNDPRHFVNRLEPFEDEEGSRLSGEARFEENSVSSINISSNDYENCNVLHDSQQNFGTSTFYISSPYAVRLANKRKSLTDKTYCLAKELLMTERTYRKDLEIVNVVFREEFYRQGAVQSAAVDRILSLVDPLYERHCSLLRDLEQRLAFWEGRPSNRNSSGTRGVADILVLHKAMTEIHSHYLDNLSAALDLLYVELSENSDFATVYRHFESQKVCYLPLTSFLLRATFRIPYYAALLKDLLSCYNTQHENYNACVDMLAELKTPCENFDGRILPLVNFVKLMELQRSLIGFPNLVDKEREFIREGSLFKLTKNGSQQHMFFLFSDTLLWATRVHGGQLLFRIRGRLPSTDLHVESANPMHGVSHCFSLNAQHQRTLVVGAPSERELSLWLGDLKREVSNGGEHPSEDKEAEDEEYEEVEVVISEEEKVTHVNTSMHICWHRNISVSCQDLLLSMKHSMSGYLLRKFRNSSGWQKVWVVLANLCLFFYRSYLEESPLASLPLAGYRITRTSSTDLVHGELVFKLLFKYHEYFFTVENKHTFDRWMEAVGICTLTQEENTRL